MLDAIVPRTELRSTLARLVDYAAGTDVLPGKDILPAERGGRLENAEGADDAPATEARLAGPEDVSSN